MILFRDPVHSIIQLDKEEDKLYLDIIDTPEFQRLRHIRQLGFSYFTYPGAEHSRFTHSLGVFHVMKRIIERIITSHEKTIVSFIEEIKKHKQLALVSALIHDVGHGPFSHAMEAVTHIRHEKWTSAIILGQTELNRVLETFRDGFSDEVAQVIERTHPSQAVVRLLSSQLDADRIDYLLRDSLMTGAKYGFFDIEWMIQAIRVGLIDGEIEVGLDLAKGQSIAEDFVMARYYMYHNVYYHKTTRSAELMILKVFERVFELLDHNESLPVPRELIQIKRNGLEVHTVNDYLQLNEHTIWHYLNLWRTNQDPVLSLLADSLLKRRLYKSIGDLDTSGEIIPVLKEISEKIEIPLHYLLIVDRLDYGFYNAEIYGEKGDIKINSKSEASEHIYLFDKKGIGHELSTVSNIIDNIKNKRLNKRCYYVPENVRNSLKNQGLLG